MTANPEAIAWYLKRSEDLLKELREQAELLRRRGGQTAGFSGTALALAGADAESFLTALHGAGRVCAGTALLAGSLLLILAFTTALRAASTPHFALDLSSAEVLNYASERFTAEPELWRVHVRTIRGLIDSTELATLQRDQTARVIARAERLFSAGLSAVGAALAILVVVVTF